MQSVIIKKGFSSGITMAKHSQSAKFTATNIFCGLRSFSELEVRISALPLEKERGDAFEVFAEAYLATQPICQVKEVWPQTSAPSTLLKSLALPVSRDMGTDGLVELKDGRIASYQAKFFSGRPSLNWGILSTFFAISDRVSHTIIFTNSDTLSATIEQRQNFIAIRGVDLDRLTPADFAGIEKWLKGQPIARTIPKPRPHQERALNDLLPALEQSDRATVIMACGTGKTLLSLWAAERIKAKNVLVLVPSLALIQQTLHGWLAATRWDNLAYLCVCSDPTITDGADELVVKKSDLDFEVTTAPADVKRFLDTKFSGVKVVFSTYMSASVVGKALEGREIFDLGIFDEAHKTAGREGKTYAFALSNENLPLKKRVFMTATPRHYNVLKRDKEGDAKLVYSMDVPESYGSVVHKLPFAEAARAGIISRYKVVISVVTSEMVGQEFLKQGKVNVKGDEVHAHQVANQLALAAAVEKHGVGKIITFHRNIKSAQSFTSDSPEGISSHLKCFSIFHINGLMPSVEREKLMREFKASKQGLVSNAKCLTEGVDVPAVDMVAFLSPKRSTVDIVQATGRAMRKAPNKEFGYILVPLYLEVEKNESVEEAVSRGKYDEVWDVLAALQEQDDVLADIIREMRQDIGRIKGYNDTRLQDKIEILGPSVSLEELKKNITTICVNKLSHNWDERFGELVAYKAKFGDCNVIQGWLSNPGLAGWVSEQRRRKAKGKLSKERVDRLSEICFDWNPLESVWGEGFQALVRYKAKYGDCNVPLIWPNNLDLGVWVSLQRKSKIAGKISKERINRLTMIGFDWSPYESNWEKKFHALEQYRDIHGDSNVPEGWDENTGLAIWVGKQRTSKVKGTISKERVSRLTGIGFDWDPIASAWNRNFFALEKYKAKYGNCDVPARWPENKILGNWVNIQRRRLIKKRISREQEEKLAALGFDWNPTESLWKDKFNALKRYKEKYGDCNIPDQWKENPSLGQWVGYQRKKKESGNLSKDQINKLTAIGFDWDPLGADWEENFHAIVQYKAKHGDCTVPWEWSENTRLARWVSTQRYRKTVGRLQKERKVRLDAIGFDWDPLVTRWEENFLALKQYKSKHGDCNVPWKWPGNSSLSIWVSKQRIAKIAGKLPNDKENRLNAIGFEWKKT